MANKLFRVAVVSTPRTGNTWINHCLAQVTGAEQFSAHRYTDVADLPLPERIIFQIHVPYQDKAFHRFLTKNNFKVVTVARHPLDVLISMLRFAQVQTGCLQWLDGKAKAEMLYGLDPSQPDFINWCLSDEGARLLRISYDWAKSDQAYAIRYEDMLDDPVAHMGKALQQLGVKAGVNDITAALEKFNPDFFKKQADHSWKAAKDNWKSFFTKKDALKLFDKYADIFDYFHYNVSGGVNVKRSENLTAWDVHPPKLTVEELLYNAVKETEAHTKKFQLEVMSKDREIEVLESAISQQRIDFASSRKRIEELSSDVQALEARIREFENQGIRYHTRAATAFYVRKLKQKLK